VAQHQYVEYDEKSAERQAVRDSLRSRPGGKCGTWVAEYSYRMHLVNTAAVPQYDGLKYSGDESDARHLAHLLRLGILPEG